MRKLASLLNLSLLTLGAAFPAQAQPGASLIGLGALLDPAAAGLVAPRHSGKPDPRWTNFDWLFTDSQIDGSRMRLYHYEGEDWTARYALPEIRREIEELKGDFNGYVPSKNFSYVLFTSHKNFRQTNVFNITEGVQGITSTTEPVMAIPYWGEAETYRHISTHEMVHQFQVQKMNDVSGGRAAQQTILPLWFIEGQAEYYSLRGMDSQSRHYIRDMIAFPDEKKDHKMRAFFEDGPPSFLTVYKLGQARMDFLESRYGKGTIQRLLEEGAKATANTTWTKFATEQLKASEAQVEADWKAYLDKNYKAEADKLPQDFSQFEEVKNAGDTLDIFDVSPDGSMILTREIDPLTGEGSLQMIDLKNDFKKTRVAGDNRPGSLSFHFMELPILSISDHHVAYFAESTSGPVLKIRTWQRKGSSVDVSGKLSFPIYDFGIQEALSPVISPDEKRVAFIGLDLEGHQDVYVLDLEQGAKPRVIVDTVYANRDLAWTKDGILLASDRTPDQRYAIYLLDPETKALKPLRSDSTDQLAPDGSASRFVFQSWSSGSSQIHLREGGKETRITGVKTAALLPKLRGDDLYFIGFKSGRNHLYKATSKSLLSEPVAKPTVTKAEPWQANLATIPPPDQQPYHPFRMSNLRLDQLMAFFASGSALGLGFSVSDLMRDYNLSGELSTLGSWSLLNANLYFTSRRGRWDWIGGFYASALPRLDLDPENPNTESLYLNREVGLVGGFRYPFSAFDYGEVFISGSRVNRATYTDPFTGEVFEPRRPGHDWLIGPTFRLGRDRLSYEAFTGPFSGYGVFLESAFGFYTTSKLSSQRYRLDGSYYVRLFGPTVLAFEGIAGAATGSFEEPFFVSSDDILRAYRFGDRRLIGNYMLVGRTELRFPIGSLFKFPFLRGIAGYDLGSVFNHRSQLGTNVATSASLGLLLNLPPISLGFIWTKPLRTAPGLADSSLLHFALRYLYF